MRSSALAITASFALVALGIAACGDSSTGAGGAGGHATTAATGTGTATTKASTGASTTAGPGSGGGASCDEPQGTPSATLNVGITTVTGNVTDITGAPANQQPVQLCGKNQCLYGTTGSDGGVIVNNGGGNLDRPLFKVGDGITTARSAYPVTTGTMTVTASVMNMTDSTKVIMSGSTITIGGATLELTGATAVGFDISVSGAAQETFRAIEAPAAKIDAIAPGQSFLAVYGLGPFETNFCPAAKLTVKNDTGLAANAQVDIYLQELNIGEGYGTYGNWTKVADGVVSSDGASISTTATSGLPELGMVGIKAK
jgi:hypothetical protein